MKTDAEGYLLDRSEWTPEIMMQLAKADGVDLTDQHIVYIMKAREMYEESGTVPLIRVFAKQFGMDRKAKALYDLFETGPMKRIAKWGGLPKATGCV